ncbi:multidrug ABC transporter ATP-binding protein [Anaeromassilibacillus sp. An172]|uniref:ABC transporter ATP-binding protein n=1 Tax=Anaeromassilibacillus sp. An172 TaxID=1965570 RepID=UPI000B3A3041|nr:ABC transporter ATP-binding protein [Anaeromassilibacillus sp. An172]OUP80345.1 multidrug ABC transporter ATP-binding protein [Anaeromassilibacillus sp. An172]
MTEIKIENLVKTIKGNKVIDNITLTLTSPKIVGFKGINGSGKTMLMRLICGLIKPTDGTITINGKVLHKDISFPESVGILIENPAFLDGYSGFENLKMLASIKNIVKDYQIKDIIKAVGLNPDDKKHYKKYSLGMKQRLGIACALMESPDIIVLDEPTNALDSDGITMVKELIVQKREEGALVIISCHDIDILKELSEEIYVLEQGKLTDHFNVEE